MNQLFLPILFVLTVILIPVIFFYLKRPVKTLFSCPWFSVVKKNHYFSVEYKQKPSGIVIVPILDNEKIIFIRNYRFAIGIHSWELPRGFIDDGENSLKAALRELKEETGYQGKLENCTPIGQVFPDTSVINNYLPVILVHLSSNQKTNDPLDKEVSGVEEVPLSELDKFITSHFVSCGITLSALYHYNKK